LNKKIIGLCILGLLVVAVSYYYFTQSPSLKFVDASPVTITLREGENKTIFVNVEYDSVTGSNATFHDLTLNINIPNYDGKSLDISTNEFSAGNLSVSGARTGDIPIYIKANKLLSGTQITYDGYIELYSGTNKMDEKPIEIIMTK
jgi:hypothetical protein